MKRVVEGQLYDTETATRVWEYRFAKRSTYCFEETVLYITTNRNFFFAGMGGELSRWGKVTPDGIGIEPLYAEMALDWLETVNASNEVIMQYFGDFDGEEA